MELLYNLITKHTSETSTSKRRIRTHDPIAIVIVLQILVKANRKKWSKKVENKIFTCLVWRSWEQAAMVAARGMTTGSLVGWLSVSDGAMAGSSKWATWDKVVSVVEVMPASVWKETIGISFGKGWFLMKSFLFSYVRSSSACRSPWEDKKKKFEYFCNAFKII